MPRRRLYGEILKTTLAGSAPFYLTARPVGKGWVRYVTSAYCVNQSSDNNDIIFGKIVGKNFHGMEGASQAKRYVGMQTQNTHHFIAGEEPTFYLQDGSATDVFEAYLEGYETEINDV